MARVIITDSLKAEIFKKFKNESKEVLKNLYSLKENPHKGKAVGHIDDFVIKELKYKSFRFYFITNGYAIKMLKEEELKNLLIKFVRMSDKDDQQKTIDEIKYILRRFGEEKF